MKCEYCKFRKGRHTIIYGYICVDCLCKKEGLMICQKCGDVMPRDKICVKCKVGDDKSTYDGKRKPKIFKDFKTLKEIYSKLDEEAKAKIRLDDEKRLKKLRTKVKWD